MSRVEVFADIVCPFTHVGLRRLSEARRGRETSPVVRVRAWPLEWLNGVPLDPDMVAHEIDALRAQVAPDMFAGFDAATFPRTSIPAFGLAAAAYAVDDLTGEVMSLALRDALFERGKDISDDDVLREIGQPFGVEPLARSVAESAVRTDWERGKRETCKAHRTSSLVIAAGSVRASTSAMTVGDSISRSPRRQCATSMPRRSAS